MHELSVAQRIVDSVEEAARKAGAERVLVVRLRVGEASGVMADAVAFCFEAVTRGTLLEGARLELEVLPRVIRCRKCGHEGPVPPTMPCPQCDYWGLQTLEGSQLEIVDIDIE